MLCISVTLNGNVNLVNAMFLRPAEKRDIYTQR